MKNLLMSAATFVCLIASVQAQDPPAYKDPSPQLYHLSARASEIDPRVKAQPEIDFLLMKGKKPIDTEKGVVDTRVPPQGRLVMWLMSYNEELADRTASYGLHFIQLHYANGWFPKLNPLAGEDDQYLGNIRLEVATGRDVSPAIHIPKPDSIVERAFQLIKYLAKTHPQGKWEQFLTPDGKEILWEKVTLAGASHGSTTSARFAKHQRVDRVVMFCGPRDQLDVWQALPSATPPNRYFGFSHVLDGGWSGDHYCRSWEMLGLNEFGPIVDVDKVPAPYQNTRRLITAADVGEDTKHARAHGCVVPSKAAVKDSNGNYIHEEVWRYLFMHPVDEVGEKTAEDPSCNKDQRSKPPGKKS